MVSDKQQENVSSFGSKSDIITTLFASGKQTEEIRSKNHRDVGHVHLVHIPNSMHSLSKEQQSLQEHLNQ